MQRESFNTRRLEALRSLLRLKAQTGFAPNGEQLSVEGLERLIAVVGNGRSPPEVQEFDVPYVIIVDVFIRDCLQLAGRASHVTRAGVSRTTEEVYLDHSGKFWWYEHQDRYPIAMLIEMMLKALDDTAARRTAVGGVGPWESLGQAKGAVLAEINDLSGRFALMPDDRVLMGSRSVVMIPVLRKDELTFCLKHSKGPLDDFTGLNLGPQEMMGTTFSVIETDAAIQFGEAVLSTVTPEIEPLFGSAGARLTPWMTLEKEAIARLLDTNESQLLTSPLVDFARCVFRALPRLLPANNTSLRKKLEGLQSVPSFRLNVMHAATSVSNMIGVIAETRSITPDIDHELAELFGWKLPVKPVSLLAMRLDGMLEIARQVDRDRSKS